MTSPSSTAAPAPRAARARSAATTWWTPAADDAACSCGGRWPVPARVAARSASRPTSLVSSLGPDEPPGDDQEERQPDQADRRGVAELEVVEHQSIEVDGERAAAVAGSPLGHGPDQREAVQVLNRGDQCDDDRR